MCYECLPAFRSNNIVLRRHILVGVTRDFVMQVVSYNLKCGHLTVPGGCVPFEELPICRKA